MKTRMIGNLEVSEIGIGCMGFSHGYGKVPEETYGIEAIQKAHDFGCTFFDTAEGYGDVVFYPGHNEQLVGKAIEGFRKDVVLATKFRVNTSEYGDGVTLFDAIRKHLDSSLKNLRTSYIDLYYLHRTDDGVPFENVAEVMGIFIKEGIIRGWGMSQISGETLTKAHAVTPVTAVQNIYSMLERDCEKDIFPFCMENNIGVVPFSPIASGFLSGKVTTNTLFETVDDVRNWVPQLTKENVVANQPILDILADFSAKKNATNAQISLAWMLHKYPNVVPIPGSKNQERILENLGSCDVILTEEEFAALESALDKCVVHGHRGHVESDQNNFGNKWKKK
jgi:aryl-alcohol dehydrogenase-like predicted oxidoreductase